MAAKDNGKDSGDDTVVMSNAVFHKIVDLNREAKSKVSVVGGNSVQAGYRDATIGVLDEQFNLLEIFETD